MGGGAWGSLFEWKAAQVVFDDGPWISSVTHDRAQPNDLLHVFATDFADTLQAQRALHPEGPWDNARVIQSCQLPTNDGKAFCASVIVHDELSDPTRPSEIAVSYGLDTTAVLGTGNADDYWSRLVWASVP